MRMFHFSWSDFSIWVNINCIFLSFHIAFSFVYQYRKKDNIKKGKWSSNKARNINGLYENLPLQCRLHQPKTLQKALTLGSIKHLLCKEK